MVEPVALLLEKLDGVVGELPFFKKKNEKDPPSTPKYTSDDVTFISKPAL